MRLKDALSTIDQNTPIRIFTGCTTLFFGRMAKASKRKWNLKVLPYMNCDVLHQHIVNEIVVLVI